MSLTKLFLLFLLCLAIYLLFVLVIIFFRTRNFPKINFWLRQNRWMSDFGGFFKLENITALAGLIISLVALKVSLDVSDLKEIIKATRNGSAALITLTDSGTITTVGSRLIIYIKVKNDGILPAKNITANLDLFPASSDSSKKEKKLNYIVEITRIEHVARQESAELGFWIFLPYEVEYEQVRPKRDSDSFLGEFMIQYFNGYENVSDTVKKNIRATYYPSKSLKLEQFFYPKETNGFESRNRQK